MTSQELRRAMRILGAGNAVQLAEIISRDPNTTRMYLRGDAEVPQALGDLVRAKVRIVYLEERVRELEEENLRLRMERDLSAGAPD